MAAELLNELSLSSPLTVHRWSTAAAARGHQSIVVHAGSGRELDDVRTYCRESGSALIELATGSKLEMAESGFPVILCPNTNILMLKFMNMLARSGRLFKGCQIELTESHQTEKRSAPGTAIAIAQSLGLSAQDVVSVRDREEQLTALRIPAEHLGRHAAHSIHIEDGACRISLETRVYGASPYADGVAKIVSAIVSHQLENRVYAIDEFVEHGWV
ncbi:dihydrodipicolinate reductase C-terminal domain-containing protein [Dechloromonas denitrificans]|uniref:dihydrodipicolinate reductase C-terminal domain-containing protein n=1 Tax=Dechloromonas denitrificans TaxID=281362 RepID=UPI001CFA2AAC|nr:dihydrodipicolinate reductase C-terminal domain-containing protein [Dechloromonas denitrificans]